MGIYQYKGYYNRIEVEEGLYEEGVLTGRYGTLNYRRCKDGFAIVDSCFLGSGFGADFGVPDFINDIPVTELHKKISISNSHSIAIEGDQLKRVHLQFAKESIENEINRRGYESNPLAALVLIMSRDIDSANQIDESLDISIDFCNSTNSVEYCEVQCDQKCILHTINTSSLKVKAPIIVLNGHAAQMLERIELSGRVYPFVWGDWDGDCINNDYFEGMSKIQFIDGTLRGDVCWSFKNYSSLKSVHLANGITKIPPYSFFNCKSLDDLYVPDTVTEIGEYAFSGCENLKSIHLPAGIRVIPAGAFKDCRSLLKCYLSDSIEIIENEAFSGCTALRKPWIPKSIKEIGETAFDNPSWKTY